MKIHVHIDKKKKTVKFFTFLFFVLFTISIYFPLAFLARNKIQNKREKPEPVLKADAIENLPSLTEYKESVQKGQTLSDILELYGFSSSEIFQIIETVKPVYDLANIKAGKELRLFSTPYRNVIAMEYDVDKEHFLYIEKRGNSYFSEIREYAFEVKTQLIGGFIENHLISALEKLGENASLAIQLANIFSWDIDFNSDLRQGDGFKILFEKKILDGKFGGYGKILAAEFVNQGKTFQAFEFTYPDTKKSDYFDFGGNSLRKEFLKSPLASPRVTSRFSLSRLHPVQKVYRPHYGVDYGAPVGTPVYATADGTVSFVGRNGKAGLMLKIKHAKGYETQYLHLQKYVKGVRKGRRVEGGQHIAWVGMSGETNGPHLDYRIKHHGTYINPLSARFDPVAPLRKEFFEEFRKRTLYHTLSMEAPWIIFSSL